MGQHRISKEANDELDGGVIPEKGMLKFMGYDVGIKGAPDGERREILCNIFYGENLPFVESSEYMQVWGDPGSVKRLPRMSNSIASACRRNKG
jgi:hypothetical protein